MKVRNWYGDSAKSIFEVWEHVGYCIIIDEFNEEGFGMNTIVETVKVDEEDRLCFVVF